MVRGMIDNNLTASEIDGFSEAARDKMAELEHNLAEKIQDLSTHPAAASTPRGSPSSRGLSASMTTTTNDFFLPTQPACLLTSAGARLRARSQAARGIVF